MSKWTFRVHSWTPTGTADGANLVDNTHMSLQGGSATQRINIYEVYVGGQASASAPTAMVLSRDSIVGATLTGLSAGNQSNAAQDPATAALAAAQAPFVAATTKPQRSTTLGLLALSFNAFGGLTKWQAPDDRSAISMLGNTASFGEVSLSAFNVGSPGLIGSHIIYEPL